MCIAYDAKQQYQRKWRDCQGHKCAYREEEKDINKEKPMTDRQTFREENKAKKRPETAPTAKLFGNDFLPVSREYTLSRRAEVVPVHRFLRRYAGLRTFGPTSLEVYKKNTINDLL